MEEGSLMSPKSPAEHGYHDKFFNYSFSMGQREDPRTFAHHFSKAELAHWLRIFKLPSWKALITE